MDVPTRSFVTSWMGLLGSASLIMVKHYLILDWQTKDVHENAWRIEGITFTAVRGAEERVGHEPLQGVVLDDDAAGV